MNNTYCIGKFRFESYEDYRKALDDIEKIRQISAKTDINEPGMAQKLYTLVRQGKINFHSVVGTDYMLYLSDIMMEESQEEKGLKALKPKSRQAGSQKASGSRARSGFQGTSGSWARSGSQGASGAQVRSESQGTSGSRARSGSQKQSGIRAAQPPETEERVWTIRFTTRQVIGALCMAGALISFLIFAGSELHDKQKTREMENLKTEQQLTVVSDWISSKMSDKIAAKRAQEEEPLIAETHVVENEPHATALQNEEQKEREPKILPEYQDAYEQNHDLAGWITIAGTQIDYPVMQSSAENPDYYLHYNFNGEEDINGSIFMDARNNYQKPDSNLIIYGHNMKSGMMFGGLKQYLDKAYWKEHPMITFNTIYERAQYEIIAVCLSEVGYQDDAELRYYDFLNAEDETQFQAYVENVRAWNVFDEPVELNADDQLLTLSTCNNYTEDGRMFLVARKCLAD